MINTVVSFSGGRSSAYMLIQLVERNVPFDKIVFANTGKEREETLEFVQQVSEYIGKKIYWVEYTPADEGFVEVNFESASRKGEPFEAFIDKRGFLPNVAWRMCTTELKIRPKKRFLVSLGWERWISLIGIRYDEPLRWGKIIQNAQKQRWHNELPMLEWETTNQVVMDFWRRMPFNLKLQPHEGNCDLCFLKGKRKVLQYLRDYPASAEWWAAIEKKYGATFRKSISVEQLLLQSKQPLLFDEYDIDFPCFCNAD